MVKCIKIYFNFIESDIEIGIGVQLENQNFFITILVAYVMNSN